MVDSWETWGKVTPKSLENDIDNKNTRDALEIARCLPFTEGETEA